MAGLDDMTVRINIVTNLITMGKKYQTRDGRAVRILATDFKAGATSVIGTIILTDGNEIVGLWSASGKTYPWDSSNNPDDLIPVPTKHEGWVVLSAISQAMGFVSLDEAQEVASKQNGSVVAHVTWES